MIKDKIYFTGLKKKDRMIRKIAIITTCVSCCTAAVFIPLTIAISQQNNNQVMDKTNKTEVSGEAHNIENNSYELILD